MEGAKKPLKRLMIAMAIAFLPAVTLAQNRITYSYDAAGNRVERTIVLPDSPAAQPSHSSFYTDMVADKRMKIYPNPTKGHLKVQILGLSDKDKGVITVCATDGRKLFSTNILSEHTTIDLTSQQNGLYLLIVKVNEKTTSWKIIKQP